MQQEINFYTLMERKSRWSFWLEPRCLQLVWLTFMVILILISFGDTFRLYSQTVQVKKLMVEQSQAETVLAHLKTDMTEEELQEILTRLGISDQPENSVALSAQYFPDILRALSAAVTRGVWLAGIQVSGEHKSMNLSGATMNPVFMQSFLSNLGRQNVFNHFSFQLGSLKNAGFSEKNLSSVLLFQISGMENVGT